MKVSANDLLQQLPPYQDEWLLVKQNQEVKDIRRLIEQSHKQFAGYYDQIALYFDGKSIDEICSNIDRFIRENIKYKEEPVKMQTTALPTGILVRGYGDCKHYASFSAGILNALERLTGRQINWCYRFASYNLNPTPHHVFVVVNDNGDEIWIDPVPGSDAAQPLWMHDKKIKVSSMPLYQNIAGIGKTVLVSNNKLQSIGTKSIAVYPVKTHDLNFDNKFPGFKDVWKSHGSPVLTLDPGYGHSDDAWAGYNIANLPQLTDALNVEIAKGPEPHVVSSDLVDWIWKSSVRSWNFYYTQGVAPDVIQIANEKLPPEWPRAIVTPDGRLTFDKIANIWDTHNPYIHLLTGAIQKYLNDYLKDKSYIISPNQPVEYMNYQHPGDFDKINMFGQIRGDNIFQVIFQGVKDFYIKFEEMSMKLILSTPRNMFLLLIGFNVFHWASHLNDQIANGKWGDISAKWKGIGGDPDYLLKAIDKGSKEPAIDEHGNTITGAGAAMGAIQVAAAITAAVPVIALLLKYIDKSGKASEIVAAATPLLQQQFPDIDWTPLQQGLPPIDKKTGQVIPWSTTNANNQNLGGGNDLLTKAVDNAPLVAGAVGIGTYFLLKKKGKKPNYTIPVLLAGGTFFFLHMQKKKFDTVPATRAGQVTALTNWANSGGDTAASKQSFITALNQMSDSEVTDTYNFIFNYFMKGTKPEPGTTLYNAILAISSKYSIFT